MIITIGNNKGGVGKTSITCNLAVCLGRLKRKVLVVDMDSQCNATYILLGGEVPIRGYTVYDLLDPEAQHNIRLVPERFIIETRHPNVHCLPNIEESSALDVPLGRKTPESFSLLRQRLNVLLSKTDYHYVLIDNPPSIGLWLTLSLTASHCVIVPVDAGSGSLSGLRRVLGLIATVQESLNPDLRFLRLVMNRVDLRTTVSRYLIDQVRSEYPNSHFRTLIPSNTPVQQAEYLHRTVIEHSPTSRAARAYRELAIELIELVESVQIEEAAR